MLRPRGNWRTPWRKPWGYPLQDWTPAQIFAGGWQGFYADPISGLYLFSDTAGTAPAPIDGTVARLDAPPGSPVAASFNNANVAQRPIRRADGLEFDGVDDYLAYPDNPALRFGTSDFTVAGAIFPDTLVGDHGFFSKRGTGGAGTNPGWGLRTSGAAITLEYDYLGNVVGPLYLVVSGLLQSAWNAIIVERRYAAGQAVGYLDNVAAAPAAIAVADISGTGALTMGVDATVVLRFDGRVGRTFAINRLLTAAERWRLNDWLKAGHS